MQCHQSKCEVYATFFRLAYYYHYDWDAKCKLFKSHHWQLMNAATHPPHNLESHICMC